MSTLGMMGAIAGGITMGRRNAENSRKIEEDRAFLATQREHAKSVMERERKANADRDALNEQMASGLSDAQKGASESSTSYGVADAPGVAFPSADDARAFSQNTSAMARGLNKPDAPLISPEVSGAATTTALPAAQGVKGTPLPAAGLPDMSETPASPAKVAVPMTPDGKVDVQEIVRPKRTADALFYQGPWQSKLRAEYARVHGYDKALAMDAQLKSAAELAYKQRVLEAAELQKAGDMRSAALKLNEIYNRDYVDGAFSNVRFIDNDRVEVVRFTPDGKIVDRTVQAMPDMITAARQILSEDKRAELLVGGLSKKNPMVFTDEATGQAVLYEPGTGEQQVLKGLKPNSMVLGEANLQIRKQESKERSADRAADNARADAAAARAGKLTDAQIQANKIRDAKIDGARAEFNAWKAQRIKDGLSTKVIPGHPMEKVYIMSKEPKTSEVK